MFFESEYWPAVLTSSFTISQAEFKTGYSTQNSDTFVVYVLCIILCIYQGENYWKLKKTLNKEWQY